MLYATTTVYRGSRVWVFEGRAVYAGWAVRIAKPLLLVSTPIGLVFGVMEAWRVGAWLGTLMVALLSVLGGFSWLTVRRIRSERERETHSEVQVLEEQTAVTRASPATKDPSSTNQPVSCKP